jgi:hypothetical protein
MVIRDLAAFPAARASRLHDLDRRDRHVVINAEIETRLFLEKRSSL